MVFANLLDILHWHSPVLVSDTLTECLSEPDLTANITVCSGAAISAHAEGPHPARAGQATYCSLAHCLQTQHDWKTDNTSALCP